ncbi:hypothetical protein [Bosea lathyri]|uniref:DUF2147 domain-containing protein n=1 Tax=Bosea lathyri TaxID=1036778 RepID=A0A1H6D8B1_9HYPH|nr:hypothetical protein [Bosea lathyri]SEG81338.1 hypothetical protein SAMN04488115_11812 [Bosea lathyri]
MNLVSITVAALSTVSALVSSPALAADFTRLDVLALVNRDAHAWMIDADNSRLDIEFLRIPRARTEIGKVCGPVVSLRRQPSVAAKGSYVASLMLENGKLHIVGMTALFMSIDELMAGDLCR